MAVYFAIYNRQSAGTKLPEEEWEGGKLLGETEVARIQKLEASSTKKAADLVGHFFGGDVVGKSIIVSEAAFEEEAP